MQLLSLSQYLTQYYPHKTELATALLALASSAINIQKAIARASIENTYGNAGRVNIQGEEVQHLDIIADKYCMEALNQCGVIAGVVSEEHEEAIIFDTHHDASYVVTIDPLDGSSNIETNNTIGTIFTLFERSTPRYTPITEADFLQQGKHALCAGYIAYGPAMMLVFTLGEGVYIATYDESQGDFFVSNTNVQIPASSSYSVNEGYSSYFDKKTQHYIEEKHKSCTPLRYVGSLVADIHRILYKGGIFLYPTQYKHNTPQNKLRLLYECIAIAFLIEQAGGRATNGKENILSLQPQSLHERTALYCGSLDEMSIWIA